MSSRPSHLQSKRIGIGQLCERFTVCGWLQCVSNRIKMCIETTLHVYRNDFDLYRNDRIPCEGCERSVASHECGPSANSAQCNMWWLNLTCSEGFSRSCLVFLPLQKPILEIPIRPGERSCMNWTAKTDGADSVNTAIFISYFLHFLFKREKVVVAYCRFKYN